MKKATQTLLLYSLITISVPGCRKATPDKEPSSSQSNSVTEESLVHENQRELKVQAVSLLWNKKQSANATMITDNFGTYLITARHIFARPGMFSITWQTPAKQIFEKQIIAIDNEVQNELCVCLLGDKETPIETQPRSGTLLQIVDTLRTGSAAQIAWIEQVAYSRLADHESTKAIAEWTLLPQRAVCLDTYPGPGSSGAGYTNPTEPEFFWVIAGEWPRPHLEALRAASGHKEAPGFTLVCGQLWTEIELARQQLIKQSVNK